METSQARHANRSAVLAAVVAAGRTTRTELTATTKLSPATVSRVTDMLLAEGLLAEAGPVDSGRRGRSAIMLSPRPGLGLLCGVDVGGSNCRFLLTDMLGQPLATAQEPTPAGIGAAALAEWLASRVASLTGGPLTGDAPLRAVVVGLPGMVTPDGATISGARNVPQIEGQVFTRKLTRAMRAPVVLYNDADIALIGELRFGAGRGLRRAVMFTIGAGLGAGVYLDGTLLRGTRGLVGEFGYLPTGPSDETVEELLSGPWLVRHAQALHAPVRETADVFAPELEETLAPVWERFDRALLLALVAATVAYDPEAIIIGGGLLPAVTRRFEALTARLNTIVPVAPELRPALLGDLSGALGALTVACQTAYLALGVTEADAATLPPTTPLSRLWAQEAPAATSSPDKR